MSLYIKIILKLKSQVLRENCLILMGLFLFIDIFLPFLSSCMELKLCCVYVCMYFFLYHYFVYILNVY